MSLLNRIDNQTRIGLLKEKIQKKKYVRIIEVHNGISGLIANDCKITLKNGAQIEFDGFWESSLTDSASKGFPDIEIVGLDSRLETINQILEVTNKPMIVDGDTGGEFNQFEYMVKRLERAGVSMVIIEDKIFPKRNSLEPGTKQELEKKEVFAEKINRGLKIRKNPNFMIVARIESLIAGLSMKDALSRAQIYLEAGADGIMIHSKEQNPKEILNFAQAFYQFPRKLIQGKTLVCVPTTYNTIKDQTLAHAGFQVIIHANHFLRAAYQAMEKVGKKILLCGRSFETDSDCAPVQQIFETVGFLEIKEKDKEIAEKLGSKIKVIIPTAGKDQLAIKYKKPKSLIPIYGKTILERQTETLRAAGLNKFVIIKGYKGNLLKMENVEYVENKTYLKTYVLHSLFCARDHLNSAFIFLYNDILFNENIIRNLIQAAELNKDIDIILVVDNSYQDYRHRIKKDLDLVITKNKIEESVRKIMETLEEEVSFIGSEKINRTAADYEFIGIAYFSERGAKILQDVYNDVLKKYQHKHFQEAPCVAKADFTDLIQEIVNRGYHVNILKTFKGWMEIEKEADLKLAKIIYNNAQEKNTPL